MEPSFPRKILVIELAGLGDNVHLLPALWMVRQRWPEAQLQVMVQAHVAGLFRLTPWVDRVWAYPSSPKPGLFGNWRWGSDLRAQRFDVVIDTKSTDRSSLLSWLTRAPRRIGRRPADGGPFGWRYLFTQVIDAPYYQESMYLQKWRALGQAGFECSEPAFHIVIDPQLRRQIGIEAADEGSYFHLSPFTTAAARELPLAQIVELIGGLRRRFPEQRWILSCADSSREKAKLRELLSLMPEPPWKIFAGTLDVAGLAAMIQTCLLNFSGDTGSLHVALMTGTPAIAWFRAHKGQKEWIPVTGAYRVLIADGGDPDALHGIATNAVIEETAQLLESALPEWRFTPDLRTVKSIAVN